MPGYFDTLKDMLVYKGQTRAESFELLEDENEKTDSQSNEGNKGSSQIKNQSYGSESGKQSDEQDGSNLIISTDIETNLCNLNSELNFSKNQSIVVREFEIGINIRGFIIFVEGMVDAKTINEDILKQLMNAENFNNLNNKYPVDYVINRVIPINNIKKTSKLDTAVVDILSGITALFIDGCSECILMNTKGYEKRKIEKPITENVVRGSQEGFTEDLDTNLSIIRRIIKNKNLMVEVLDIGDTNNSKCAVLYIEDIVNTKLVEEVKRRIKNTHIDMALGDGMVEQLIEDHPFMILPQILGTERPDRTCSFLMDGKIALISEGAPFANIMPITFFHLFHTSEDYFLRWQYGTFLRLIRLTAFLIAIYLPGLYVALSLYHQEMIPTELLISIAQSRESVPFPVIVEILFMELSFELIREAGIRVPSTLGQTIGIVGALILGQAAVAAGLVSPVLLIIVAITGLGNFAVPNYSLAIAMRILRFMYIILGAILGFYGIVVGTFILACLSASMKSFGVPYFSPVAPKTKSNHDLVLRWPLWKLWERPDMLNTKIKSKKKDPRGWKNTDTRDDRDD